MIGADRNYQVSVARQGISSCYTPLTVIPSSRYLLVNSSSDLPGKLSNYLMISSRQEMYVHRIHGAQRKAMDTFSQGIANYLEPLSTVVG
jgi:hypothetical protein